MAQQQPMAQVGTGNNASDMDPGQAGAPIIAPSYGVVAPAGTNNMGAATAVQGALQSIQSAKGTMAADAEQSLANAAMQFKRYITTRQGELSAAIAAAQDKADQRVQQMQEQTQRYTEQISVAVQQIEQQAATEEALLMRQLEQSKVPGGFRFGIPATTFTPPPLPGGPDFLAPQTSRPLTKSA